MRSRGGVEKRIAKIRQVRVHDGRTGFFYDVAAIVLEDGTSLVPVTRETEWGEYGNEILVVRKKEGSR